MTTRWQPVAGLEVEREQICASFIIHSHSDEKRYLDYGASGNGLKKGAIPLVPEPTTPKAPLKRLLKMFMRMHLQLFDICWSEAHDEPVRASAGRKLGGNYRKEWERSYHCRSCNNRWWVNHCGNGGEKKRQNITKITFSDVSDNFFEFDEHKKMGEYRLLKCATCNEAYLDRKKALFSALDQISKNSPHPLPNVRALTQKLSRREETVDSVKNIWEKCQEPGFFSSIGAFLHWINHNELPRRKPVSTKFKALFYFLNGISKSLPEPLSNAEGLTRVIEKRGETVDSVKSIWEKCQEFKSPIKAFLNWIHHNYLPRKKLMSTKKAQEDEWGRKAKAEKSETREEILARSEPFEF